MKTYTTIILALATLLFTACQKDEIPTPKRAGIDNKTFVEDTEETQYSMLQGMYRISELNVDGVDYTNDYRNMKFDLTRNGYVTVSIGNDNFNGNYRITKKNEFLIHIFGKDSFERINGTWMVSEATDRSITVMHGYNMMRFDLRVKNTEIRTP